MTDFVISGSSHAITLREGLNALVEEQPDVYGVDADSADWTVGDDSLKVFALGGARYELEEFTAVVDGRVRIVGDPAKAMRRALGSAVFNPSRAWAFANVVNTRRVFVHPMWRSVAPSALGRVGNRTPVSEAIIREIFLAEQAPIRNLYSRLAKAGVPVVAVETPRLRRDLPVFRDEEERRIALWLNDLNKRIWSEYLDALNVPFVTAPDETVDSEGFLRSDLRRLGTTKSGVADRHHANKEWAKLLLPRILDALRSVSRKTAAAS